MWEEECGKDGAEVEILEKDSTQGWGRAGLGQKGAWLGLGRGLGLALHGVEPPEAGHGWQGWSLSMGPGKPWRVSVSSFMAEARLCPFESLP